MLKLTHTHTSSFLGKVIAGSSAVLACFAIASFIFSSFIIPNSASAAATDATTTVSATVLPVASIAVANADKQVFPNITPQSTPSLVTTPTATPLNITVTTNTGKYDLSISGTDSGKLKSTSGSNSYYIEPLGTSSFIASSSFTTDRWGYSTNATTTIGTQWKGISGTATSVVTDRTTMTLSMIFGAKISTNVIAGSYSNTVTLSVTPKQ